MWPDYDNPAVWCVFRKMHESNFDYCYRDTGCRRNWKKSQKKKRREQRQRGGKRHGK